MWLSLAELVVAEKFSNRKMLSDLVEIILKLLPIQPMSWVDYGQWVVNPYFKAQCHWKDTCIYRFRTKFAFAKHQSLFLDETIICICKFQYVSRYQYTQVLITILTPGIWSSSVSTHGGAPKNRRRHTGVSQGMLDFINPLSSCNTFI